MPNWLQRRKATLPVNDKCFYCDDRAAQFLSLQKYAKELEDANQTLGKVDWNISQDNLALQKKLDEHVAHTNDLMLCQSILRARVQHNEWKHQRYAAAQNRVTEMLNQISETPIPGGKE